MPNPDNTALEKRLDSLEKEIRAIRSQIRQSGSDNAPELKISGSSKPEKTTPDENAKTRLKKPKRSIEDFLGSNLIGKFGAFALILTAGWFVKYAIDREWLNASVRIFNGVLTGYILIGTGLYFAKKQYRIIWPVVAGAGYAIVYISIYAAYYFYGFFSITESFIYIFLLSMIIVVLALYSENEVIYIFTLAGAFLIPIIHSQNQNSYKFLFSYISVIHVLYLFTAFKFAWRTSGYVLLSFFCVVSFSWAIDKLDSSNGYIVLLFLATNLAFVFIRQLLIFPKRKILPHLSDPIMNLLMSLFVLGMGLATMYLHFPGWQALWILLVLVYCGLVIYSFLKNQQGYRDSLDNPGILVWKIWPIIVAGCLSFTGAYYVFDSNWWVAGCIGFSGSWLFVSAKMDQIPMNIIGIFLWLITLVLLVFAIENPAHAFAFWNQRFLLYLLTSIILTGSWMVWRKPRHNWMRILWPFCAIPVMILATVFEFHDIIADHHIRNLSYSLILIFYASLFLIPGFWKSKKYLRYAGLAIILALILKFYFYDIWQLRTSIRIIVGLCSGVMLIVFSFLYQKFFRVEEVNQ